jgi:hypothetical protein
MTQLPAAQQLSGENRTQVTQLIANFNELITTNTEWKASYAKVDANVTALIGSGDTPDEPKTTPTPAPAGTSGAAGTTGAVGTSGTAATSIDPQVKAKLAEFRTHLKAFEKAAGGGSK